jgi:hypothetical protein
VKSLKLSESEFNFVNLVGQASFLGLGTGLLGFISIRRQNAQSWNGSVSFSDGLRAVITP